MRRRELIGGAVAGWPWLAGAFAAAPPGRPALIAAAASVQAALDEIAAEWAGESGMAVRITYGSSGNLRRQIQQGMPAELFLSADEGFALQLAADGQTLDQGVVYAAGRLALIVARTSGIELDPQLRGLKAGWASVRKFAIANPELAPYGKAAREVLQAVGLWEQAQAKLVLGENIGQATQFVTTGAAEAGITALSLLTGSEAQRHSRHVALPDSLHAPLRQRMVLMKRAGPAAAAFYRHLQTGPARATLRKHGFTVP